MDGEGGNGIGAESPGVGSESQGGGGMPQGQLQGAPAPDMSSMAQQLAETRDGVAALYGGYQEINAKTQALNDLQSRLQALVSPQGRPDVIEDYDGELRQQRDHGHAQQQQISAIVNLLQNYFGQQEQQQVQAQQVQAQQQQAQMQAYVAHHTDAIDTELAEQGYPGFAQYAPLVREKCFGYLEDAARRGYEGTPQWEGLVARANSPEFWKVVYRDHVSPGINNTATLHNRLYARRAIAGRQLTPEQSVYQGRHNYS